MTAIFMVWNTTGLAIASDRSSSATEKDESGNRRVLFNEYENKIFKPKNRNFAVASAGSAAINGVPIQSILHQWSRDLENKDTLLDYAYDFIDWFARLSILESAAPNESITLNYFKACINHCLEEISQLSAEEEQVRKINEIFDDWESVNPPNIYGEKIQEIGHKFKANGSNDTDERAYNEFIHRFKDFELEEVTKKISDENVNSVFLKAFQDALNHEFDESIAWANELRTRMLYFFYNFINNSWDYAELMIAGYGEIDWLPSAIKIRIYDFDQAIPWVVVTKVTDCDAVWYQFLGQTETVSRFWAPINSQVRSELNEALYKEFGNRKYFERVVSEIDNVITSHSNDLLDPIRNKVNLLSVDKLAYIAQQMVSLESFNSFINEYLPTVGGDIDIVKLTRVDGEFD